MKKKKKRKSPGKQRKFENSACINTFSMLALVWVLVNDVKVKDIRLFHNG